MDNDSIAVIGISCRFPGASNTKEYWQNLCQGKESLTRFSLDEIVPLTEDDIKFDPDFVPVRGMINGQAEFDAEFFSMSAREAEILDPQQRVFLEIAWAAMEDAGYVGENYPGLVGVYAGMSSNSYFVNHLKPNPKVIDNFGSFQTMVCNEKDFLATRVAYALGLKGPAISLNTGCSTSLVAICEAFNHLQSYQCDLALAGGVSIAFPEKTGYLYHENGIGSSDGHCRPFDEKAQGTVFSNGAGAVILKRTEDAIEDGDHIYAVIRGVGLNNDGADKLSFTAPSIDGQANAIMMAHTTADINPENIGYVETHGTATPVGDPIEVEALTQAFHSQTQQKQYCAIGSVKSNIGHTDTAAGIAGFIKTTLALYHQSIPPSINYTRPNPKIDFEKTPFFVNTQTTAWPSDSKLAGVSSFGVGGTNAHIVLEPAPEIPPSNAQDRPPLIMLSARSPEALKQSAAQLATDLEAVDLQNPTAPTLNDIAFTLRQGRKAFSHRLTVSGNPIDTLKLSLKKFDKTKMTVQRALDTQPELVFMFPGGGSQYTEMGLELYHTEPLFQQLLDDGFALYQKITGNDLKAILYPPADALKQADIDLKHPSRQLPAIFIIEFALARLLMSWGLEPKALIGHSMGENTAACLAGVFTFEAALRLITLRGELFETVTEGGMLSISTDLASLTGLIDDNVDIAAINGPQQCTVSGPTDVLAALQEKLINADIEVQKIPISIAAHSRLLDPILAPFQDYLESIELNPPNIAFISNLTGTWISDEQAVSSDYWTQHLRNAVRFSDGISELQKETGRLFIEVGPGKILSSLARLHAPQLANQITPSMRHAQEEMTDPCFLMETLGKLWAIGANIDWKKIYDDSGSRRVPLSSYSFQHKRYLIEAMPTAATTTTTAATNTHSMDYNLPLATASIANGNTVPEQDTSTTAPPAEPISRIQLVLQKLITIVKDMSGLDDQDIDLDATFLELGFDSLFLSQASLKFKKVFGIKITFRELFVEANTLSALSTYIDERLADDALSDELAAINKPKITTPRVAAQSNHLAVPDPALVNSLEQLSASNSPVVRVIAQQLQVMRQQLDALTAGSTITVTPEQPLVTSTLDAVPDAVTASSQASPQASTKEPLIRSYNMATTPSQREIWLTSQFSPEASCSYNLCHCLTMKGSLDKDVFSQALHTVFMRHDILRASFSLDGMQQNIVSQASIAFTTEDLSAFSSEEKQTQLKKLQHKEVSTPFVLDKGPLARFMLIKLDQHSFHFLLTIHHIICDEISIGIIISDLAEYYSAAIETREPALRALMQPDSTALDATDDASHSAYWLEQFSDNPVAIDLPTDFKRPALKTYDASIAMHQLDKAFSTQIKQASTNMQATLFSFLFSSFQVFMAKISGQNDVTIGVPVSVVDRSEQDTVGYWLNVLPIRGQLSGDCSFSKHLITTYQNLFDHFEHNKFTFGSLVEQLKIPRDASRNPIVSVLFNLDTEDSPPVFSNLDVNLEPVFKAYENFDLFLCVVQAHGKIGFQCIYNKNLFTAATIRQWLAGFETLLRSVLNNAEQSIGSLSLATEKDVDHLQQYNATQTDYASDTVLSTLLSQQTKNSANAQQTAVISGDQSLSYSELEQRSNQLAHHLIDSGVNHQDLVGICLHRSVDMLIGLLGIWKAGAAYVPLDPDYPNERLQYMLETTAVQVVVTQDTLLSITADFACRSICLDRDQAAIANEDTHLPTVKSSADDVAYVIFTSGSTGKPKGVQVHHGAVLNFLHSMADKPKLTAQDKLLAVTTLSFDIAVLELYLPLLVGGTTVIASRDDTADGNRLIQLIDQHGINTLQATPSTWRLLLAAGWQGNAHFKALCGGEALPQDLVAQLLPRVGQLWNMYGPTETTVWSTCYRITDAQAPIFIGTPIANTQCHVLDEYLQPQPIGVPGELYIGGDGVTQGYLKREDLTTERFIADPFSDDTQARLYRTGDRVRWHHSGELEYFNRVDNQVKVRGFRIELGEIEAILSTHTLIRECAVIVREDQPGDQRLVAYAVLSSANEFNTAQMRQHLRADLPEYMIPQHVVVLDHLPLTLNGKVDRKRLPQPAKQNQQIDNNDLPKTDSEIYLAGLWAEYLDDDSPIYLDDNFFDIGGHSLLTAQLSARIHSDKQITIPMRCFITNTLEQISDMYLSAEAKNDTETSTTDQTQPASKPRTLMTRLRDKLSFGR